MDRVEFLNSISYRDESERRSMIELFWDQYMVLYSLVDNIEDCCRIENNVNELPGTVIRFYLKYNNHKDVDKIEQTISSQPYLQQYGTTYTIEYQRSADSDIVITIRRLNEALGVTP